MKSFKGSIKGFPKEVVKQMLKEQVAQGNKKDISVFEASKMVAKSSNGFTWDNTKDGHDFWREVIKQERFDVFFEKYPKKSEGKKLTKGFKGNIEHLPKEVVEKAIEYVIKHKEVSRKKAIIFLEDDGLVGSFDWSDTPEGWEFWDDIYEGRGLYKFFERYPKKSKKKKSKVKSLSLKDPIYRMNRKGSFSIDRHTSNQCGAEGLNRYEFEIVLILKQELDDDGFIFDHDLIQKAIDDAELYGSCEEIQKKIHDVVNNIIPEGVLLAYKCSIKPLDFYVKAYIEYMSCSDLSYYSLL